MNPNKYLLFIDETDDHSLSSVDPGFPIFVLLGCLFKTTDYEHICEEVRNFKIDFFGSEHVILHSREIRKCEGVFAKLFDLDHKKIFYERLNAIITAHSFTVIAVAIKKQEFIDRYGTLADDPYQLSLSFLLERTLMHTDGGNNQVDVVIEGRGSREDQTLLKRYNRLIDRGSGHITKDRFQARFTGATFKRKKENDCGLQIADLCAYPMARHLISPEQPYPAYEVVAPKVRKGPKENPLGYGLKIFP